MAARLAAAAEEREGLLRRLAQEEAHNTDVLQVWWGGSGPLAAYEAETPCRLRVSPPRSQKRLADARRDKLELEVALEAEQDFVVNRLQRSLRAAQAAQSRAEAVIAALGSPAASAAVVEVALAALPLPAAGDVEAATSAAAVFRRGLEAALAGALKSEVDARRLALRQQVGAQQKV